jgi:hypothetical protein
VDMAMGNNPGWIAANEPPRGIENAAPGHK